MDFCEQISEENKKKETGFSGGSQTKYFKDDYWYKEDFYGGEAEAEKIASVENKEIYQAYDYEITIEKNNSDVKFSCKGLYNQMQYYFDVGFNHIKRTFYANPTMPVPITQETQHLWLIGVQNIALLIQELDKNVDRLIPKDCTYNGLVQGEFKNSSLQEEIYER